MKKWFKRFKNQKGMTLVELLAVVVILGIVAAIAVPAVSNIIDNSKRDAHVANGLLIINAAKLALVSNEKFSTNTDGAVVIPVSKSGGNNDLIDKRFLDAMPKDPFGKSAYTSATVYYTNGKYSIEIVGTNGTDIATEEELNSSGF